MWRKPSTTRQPSNSENCWGPFRTSILGQTGRNENNWLHKIFQTLGGRQPNERAPLKLHTTKNGIPPSLPHQLRIGIISAPVNRLKFKKRKEMKSSNFVKWPSGQEFNSAPFWPKCQIKSIKHLSSHWMKTFESPSRLGTVRPDTWLYRQWRHACACFVVFNSRTIMRADVTTFVDFLVATTNRGTRWRQRRLTLFLPERLIGVDGRTGKGR